MNQILTEVRSGFSRSASRIRPKGSREYRDNRSECHAATAVAEISDEQPGGAEESEEHCADKLGQRECVKLLRQDSCGDGWATLELEQRITETDANEYKFDETDPPLRINSELIERADATAHYN